MKHLTGICQGLGKCTKATLPNYYFCWAPTDDCFCLESWSRYHYNKKHRKLKIIWTWRRSKKMNRNKWKKLSKFSNAHKKVFHAFFFNIVPQQILSFLFIVHFVKSSLVLSLSILAEILCVLLTLTLSFASDWNKNMWSCAITDTAHAQRSYLTVARLSVA